jgi:hypothetical protein
MSRIARLVLATAFTFTGFVIAPPARQAHAATGFVQGYVCTVQWFKFSGYGNDGYLDVTLKTEPFCGGFITKQVVVLGSGQTKDTSVPGWSTTILANWHLALQNASNTAAIVTINGNLSSSGTQLRASSLAWSFSL